MHSAVGLFCISMKTTFDQQLELSPSATCDLSHPWVPGSGGDSPSWERTRGQSRPLSTHRGTGAGPCILQWSSRGRLIHGTSLEHLAGRERVRYRSQRFQCRLVIARKHKGAFLSHVLEEQPGLTPYRAHAHKRLLIC